jgi:alpha-1,3-rhamnosyl/mannosyltransferase
MEKNQHDPSFIGETEHPFGIWSPKFHPARGGFTRGRMKSRNHSDQLHVAVDAANLARDRRGIGRYARAILQRWLLADNIRITLLVPNVWPFMVRRRLAEVLHSDEVMVRRRQDAANLEPHIVWYPWNGMTWISPCPNVATVHDVWPFASPSEDLRKRRSEQVPFRATAANASAIITDSAFSKSEIIKHLSVAPQKIHVVPLGVELPLPAQDRPLLLDGASRYVLFVGESEPRKDLSTLKAAMSRLPDALRMTTGLVVVGKPGSKATALGRVDATKQGHVLRFEPLDSVPTLVTGEINDALLQQLYAGAAVFVFPSLYEGFGLPVLEAMAHGVPVIASNAASVPEVAGNASLYFPASDAGVLAHELTRVLSDRVLAANLRAAGITRATMFKWDRCANETLRVLTSVAQGQR